MVIPDRPTDPTAIRDWLLRQAHQAKIREAMEAQERGEQPPQQQIAASYQIRKLKEQREKAEQGQETPEQPVQPQMQRSRFAQSSREPVREGNPDYTREIQHPESIYIPQIGPSHHSLKRHHPGSQGGGEERDGRNGNGHGGKDRRNRNSRYFNYPQHR